MPIITLQQQMFTQEALFIATLQQQKLTQEAQDSMGDEVETMREEGKKGKVITEVIKSSLCYARLDHSTLHVLCALPQLCLYVC